MARTLELDTLKHPSASSANMTLASSGLTTMPSVDINGGAIDATTVGAGTPSSVAATTLTTSGNVTLCDNVADSVTINGTVTAVRAVALNDDVSLGNTVADAITIAGTTTVGTTNGDQTIDIASHDGVDGGLELAGTLVTASAAEINKLDGVTATTAEINKLASMTATTAELNVMDGGASAPSMTLTETDRIVVNDAGTMKQVLLSDLEDFMESALDTTTNITSLGTVTTGTWAATDVAVAHGGTGASTLTDGGVLLGSGTSAVTPMARLADSQMIVGQASGDPVIESGATLRTSIGCDPIGTDNSTNVTLTGTPDYITISGQAITRGLVNLTTDITGTLPVAKGGTGVTSKTGTGSVVLSASPTFTGTVSGVTKAHVGLSNVDNDSTSTIRSGTTASDVGLGSVTNASQATMQAATLSAASKSDVGLGNVNNTADASQTSVGALTSGSIASGFGAITTTGTITGGTLVAGSTTVGSNAAGARTVSTGDPSGGSNGDIHYEY